ncbi:MAG: hypothetical protein LUQ09_00125 [Methanomassiliicoccales archaeon]|nr:hypothetical protein [Methanomassiliicoccales archaeon]
MSIMRRRAVGMVAILIASVALVASFSVFFSNEDVTQTETFQLVSSDGSRYFPADALVTVTTQKTMHAMEGFDSVYVSVELVNYGNISSFRMQDITCYLGRLEDGRFDVAATDWEVVDAYGDQFEAKLDLAPLDVMDDARIMVSLGMEIYFEDGSSYFLGGYDTPPVFGYYEVQNRIVPLMLLVPALLIGTVVVHRLVKVDESGPE